jgi:hypothetical protein
MVAEGGSEVFGSTEGSALENGDFASLFERARQALTARLQLEPGIAAALALPGVPPTAVPQTPRLGTSAHLTAQVVVNEQTRHVVVRVVDAQSGTTVRELPLSALAAVAAKHGREIAHSQRR